MGRRRKSKNRKEEIPTDIIPNILSRLPTKDFVRSSSVCKLWRSIVADPSFRKLHVAHHAAAAASSEPEVLIVTETREPGRSDEASIFNLSSAKVLSQVAIPSGYHLAGVCNGFLCFALDNDQAPPVVCNPVTGETLQLPKVPLLPEHRLSHLFVLGFSAATNEYKMFRLSFPPWYPSWHPYRDGTNYISVYTLGGGRGWRQYSYTSRFHPVTSPAPVHINGNIFVPIADFADKRARAARMLVVDVAMETCRSYPIPYNFDDYHEGWHKLEDGFDLLADVFDLNGEMCLVVNVGFYPFSGKKTQQFWVMKPPYEFEGEKQDDDKLHWELRYNFRYVDPYVILAPRSVWIEHVHILCYRFGRFVYKYDMRGYSSSSDVDNLLFDKRLELPDAPLHSSAMLEFCRWSICGDHRPGLFSPHIFALPPSQDEEGKKRPLCERTLTRILMELDEHTDGIRE